MMRKKHSKGFTLIEVIIVIGALMTMAAIFMPEMAGKTQATKMLDTKVKLKQVIAAVQQCRAGEGNYNDYEWDDIETCLPEHFQRLNPWGNNWDFNATSATEFEVAVVFDNADSTNRYVKTLTPNSYRLDGSTTVYHSSY